MNLYRSNFAVNSEHFKQVLSQASRQSKFFYRKISRAILLLKDLWIKDTLLRTERKEKERSLASGGIGTNNVLVPRQTLNRSVTTTSAAHCHRNLA